jgi:hypothetical protein
MKALSDAPARVERDQRNISGSRHEDPGEWSGKASAAGPQQVSDPLTGIIGGFARVFLNCESSAVLARRRTCLYRPAPSLILMVENQGADLTKGLALTVEDN